MVRQYEQGTKKERIYCDLQLQRARVHGHHTRKHDNRQAGMVLGQGLRVYIRPASMGQRELLEIGLTFEPSNPTQCDVVPPILFQTTTLFV